MTPEQKKESQREYSKKYAQSSKGKAMRKKMRQTEDYKQMQTNWREGGGSKAEYERNKDTYVSNALVKRYGITLDDYNVMLLEQNCCCHICGKHESNNGKRLAVDHNHATGKVRKLLCHHCNAALGSVQEDLQILQKMITYIEEHNLT